MKRTRTCGSVVSRGQALVEAIVSAFALVSFLLGVAVVAKYQDVRRSVAQAARDLAFTCAADPGGCAAAAGGSGARIVLRHLTGSTAGIASGPHALEEAAVDPFWSDRLARPIVDPTTDVTVAARTLSFDAPGSWIAGAAARLFGGALQTIGRAGPSRFGLDAESGLWRHEVRLDLMSPANALEPHRAGGARVPMRVQAAVLADAWTATGPRGPEADTVETRVDRGWRLPVLDEPIAAAYLPVRGLLMAAAALGLEPAARDFRFHEFDVDLVPVDRLPAASARRSHR